MAHTIAIPPISGGTYAANTALDVSRFEKYTVYAASASTISLSSDGGATFATGTISVPAGGYITVTDLATHMKCSAVFRIVALYSHEGG